MTNFSFNLPVFNNDPVTVTEADIEEARKLSSNAADVAAGLPPSEWNVTPEQLVRNRGTNQAATTATGFDKDGISTKSLESIGGAFSSAIPQSLPGLPGGFSAQPEEIKKVVIKGPPGATAAQALAIFRQQQDNIANLAPGQSVLNFPTAGFDALGVNPSGAVSSLSNQWSDAVGSVRSLSSTSLPMASNPLSAVDFAKSVGTATKIDKLSPETVTGVLAQTSKTLGTSATTVDAVKGIGQYGMSPAQMENQGLLKPGTVDRFINNGASASITQTDIDEAARINSEGGDITAEQVASNRKLNSVLSSPVVWAGKGVNNLTDFLSNPKLQAKTQQGLLSDSIGQLKTAGLLSGKEPPSQIAALASVTAAGGIDKAQGFLKNTLPSDQQDLFNKMSADVKFSTAFVDTKLPQEMKNTKFPPGFLGTVNRQSVDVTSSTLIPSGRVNPPSFGLGTGKPVTVTQADINEAEAINAAGGSTTSEQVASNRALFGDLPVVESDEDATIRNEYTAVKNTYVETVRTPLLAMYDRVFGGEIWDNIQNEWQNLYKQSGIIYEQLNDIRKRALSAEPYSAKLIQDIGDTQGRNMNAQKVLNEIRKKALANQDGTDYKKQYIVVTNENTPNIPSGG